MRKNVKNEKVIRAMAIGISAMLTMAEPITALAAEGEGEGTVPAGGDGETIEQKQEENEVFVDAKDAVDAAEGAVETAKSAAGTVKDDVIENVVAGEATDENGKDLAQAVIDAANKIENTTATETEEGDAAEDDTAETEEGDAAEGGTAETEEGDAAEDDTAKAGNGTLAGAQTDITIADTQLGVAEAQDELFDGALTTADEKAEEADKIASDMKDAMDEAEKKVDEQLDEIKNATTTTDANAAYDDLKKTAEDAEKDFNTKLDEYEKAKGAYDEAAAKVKEYEEAYNKALKDAGTNAGAAAAELEAAKKNADALEAAVAAAKEAVGTSAKSALLIAEKENLTQTDGGLNWRKEDELFIAIMENYYLPELCQITGAKVTRVQGKDNNEYNYFVAEYKVLDENGQVVVDENGIEKTEKKYYNFKMDDDGKSKDNIVIFEKREVEIFGDPNENPDQYVKESDSKSVVDVAAGLENGTVVNADGKYYAYESKKDETLESNSEITGTSTTDVTVDENTQEESWQYDAKTGKLVKTVTAAVTTVTYVGAQFDAAKEGESYATDAARDAAAAAKEKELEDATGKDATIAETEKTTYTYTANGTYIPTFTKKVIVKNEEVEWKHTDKWNDVGVKTEAEAVAKVAEEQEKALQKKIEKDDNLYFLGVDSSLNVTGSTKGTLLDDPDFLVSGTVSATYAKVTKDTVDKDSLEALGNDVGTFFKKLFGDTNAKYTNQQLEDELKEAIIADGGIFISADWKDWKKGKATIRYVAGVKVTTDEKNTQQAAKNAVKNDALTQAKESGATGVYNVKTTGTDKIDHTTYSYTVDYLEKASEETKNKTVATETYGNAEALTGEIIQNKNYYDAINNGEIDKILLTQKDDDYRAFVDDAKKLTDKYNTLLTEAEKANKDVQAAWENVNALKKAIENLPTKGNTARLAELKAQLEIAEVNVEEAQDKKGEIDKKLADAEKELTETIARLTPAPTGGDDTDDTDDTDTTVTPPVVLATAPTTPVNVVTPTQAAQPGVVEIEDDVTPLAPSVEENVQEEVTQGETEAEEPETEETIQIDDEVSPLADIVVEDEQTKMSWWWLLIVLLLGTTGYEMYKKHNEKKQKVQAENAEDAE